jgi:hypothetical protein
MGPIITIRSENPDSRYLASAHPPVQSHHRLLSIAASAIFHPLASFQVLQGRLSLRPGKYLLHIVYPNAKYDLTIQGSQHPGLPKHPHYQGAQAASPCLRYAWRVCEIRPYFLLLAVPSILLKQCILKPPSRQSRWYC